MTDFVGLGKSCSGKEIRDMLLAKTASTGFRIGFKMEFFLFVNMWVDPIEKREEYIEGYTVCFARGQIDLVRSCAVHIFSLFSN